MRGSSGCNRIVRRVDRPSTAGRRLLLVISLGAASLSGGCSTARLYDGPELPAARAAFVLVGGKRGVTHLTGSQLFWVDGRRIEPPLYRAGVAPGCHRIDYRLCPQCYAVGRQSERRYVLAAGRSYKMDCNLFTTCASASAANTLAFDVNYDRLNRYCCSFVDAESGAAPAMCSR